MSFKLANRVCDRKELEESFIFHEGLWAWLTTAMPARGDASGVAEAVSNLQDGADTIDAWMTQIDDWNAGLASRETIDAVRLTARRILSRKNQYQEYFRQHRSNTRQQDRRVRDVFQFVCSQLCEALKEVCEAGTQQIQGYVADLEAGSEAQDDARARLAALAGIVEDVGEEVSPDSSDSP
ncbi:uncharacterized protein E0L32_006020 [Thyridium curvatum]|uniref:Uncharacterized protein n=1 Tax=Thyridium curvatum TaxID=1093900 RepID=A0A507B817_9PEZI|nr:uncharacterized protein E0L32_006020 [Thyridium curvatum]TPX13549.1 hypothetical protein E0L32_006020 [Thyridium curvatum]